MQETYLYETNFNLSGTLHFVKIICASCKEKMPGSTKFQQKTNIVISDDRDSAVQTALTGSTVYSLPKRSAKQNIVDLVLMIIDEEGPLPMFNMRPAKKTRNAVDQFNDEHQLEYEGRGQSPRDQINRVHTHNNAFPKMLDELDKRRSITQVGMTGLGGCQTLRATPANPSNPNVNLKFDPNCPKCIKRKKRLQEERKRRRPLCKRCRDERNRKEINRKESSRKESNRKKESKNKLDRVMKNKIPKPKKQQTRYRTKASKPSIICSNKCFQCCLTAATKTVSTFKSYDNLLSFPQEVTPPQLAPGIIIKENQEKNVLKSKSSHKKRVSKKPASLKSDGNPGTETGPSVSSYNSFLSTEHEPMIE